MKCSLKVGLSGLTLLINEKGSVYKTEPLPVQNRVIQSYISLGLMQRFTINDKLIRISQHR